MYEFLGRSVGSDELTSSSPLRAGREWLGHLRRINDLQTWLVTDISMEKPKNAPCICGIDRLNTLAALLWRDRTNDGGGGGDGTGGGVKVVAAKAAAVVAGVKPDAPDDAVCDAVSPNGVWP